MSSGGVTLGGASKRVPKIYCRGWVSARRPSPLPNPCAREMVSCSLSRDEVHEAGGEANDRCPAGNLETIDQDALPIHDVEHRTARQRVRLVHPNPDVAVGIG